MIKPVAEGFCRMARKQSGTRYIESPIRSLVTIQTAFRNITHTPEQPHAVHEKPVHHGRFLVQLTFEANTARPERRGFLAHKTLHISDLRGRRIDAYRNACYLLNGSR